MKPQAELIALRSMCRAAADEISENCDTYCAADEFGPPMLHARLRGELPPDIYHKFCTPEDAEQFKEIQHYTRTKTKSLTYGRKYYWTVCSKNGIWIESLASHQGLSVKRFLQSEKGGKLLNIKGWRSAQRKGFSLVKVLVTITK